ncbi:hypothetical protein BH11VER1_BH11VER1_02390 [soil metagenome]
MRSDHTFFCYQCGSQLLLTRKFEKLWIDLFECPQACEPGYLYIYDKKWIIPLQVLSPGVPQRLKEISLEEAERSLNRLRQIDYKTISIVAFERTILGSYDPKKDYRIVYPDGSE